ncbi:hypothetical protein H4R24_002337 [Coemansia sp. RSA 988]|nr:hypothetical protein H4R24_002337 [Coemansia sp. RSA 988]
MSTHSATFILNWDATPEDRQGVKDAIKKRGGVVTGESAETKNIYAQMPIHETVSSMIKMHPCISNVDIQKPYNFK